MLYYTLMLVSCQELFKKILSKIFSAIEKTAVLCYNKCTAVIESDCGFSQPETEKDKANEKNV